MFSRVRGKSPQLNCSKKADNLQKRSRIIPQLNCRKLRNVTAFFCSQLRYSSRSLLQVVGIFLQFNCGCFCWRLRDFSAEVAETPADYMQHNRDNVFKSSQKQIPQLTAAKKPTTCKRDREGNRSWTAENCGMSPQFSAVQLRCSSRSLLQVVGIFLQFNCGLFPWTFENIVTILCM